MTTLVIIVLTVLLLATAGICIYLVVQLNQLSDDYSDISRDLDTSRRIRDEQKEIIETYDSHEQHIVDELNKTVNSYLLQMLRLWAQLLELQTSHDALWQVHLSTVDKLLEMQERYEPDSLPRLLSMPWIEEHVPHLEVGTTP